MTPKHAAPLFSLLALAAAASPVLAGDCPPAPPSETALAAEAAHAADAVVEAAIADGFAGGVAIIKDGEVVYDRVAGFSDNGGKTLVACDTLFHTASITKYLTAAMTLKASEGGRLSLDDDIAIHLPPSALNERGVTIRDLLAHRSGLGSSYAAEATTTLEAAVQAIAEAPYDEARRGRFHYSNDGFDLLGAILERAYDARYEDLARMLILEPAGVSHAGFWGEMDLDDPAKVGQPLRSLDETLRRRNYGMLASAGLLITARDLARLALALSVDGVLSPSSRETLHAPVGDVSIGQALLGAFLVESDSLGPRVSALGYEDWGDNAIVSRYLDHDVIIAVVTSKGPPEGAGEPFRNRISAGLERALADTLYAD